MKARREAEASAQGGDKSQKDDSTPADVLGAGDDEDIIF
jgi:hypothetical protein